MIDYGHGVKLDYTSADDRDQFFHWRNHPAIWFWCRQNGPITYPIHTSYWYGVDQCEDKKFFSIKACESSLGATPKHFYTVGCAGLTSIDYVNSRAEFSLYIGPEHQGKNHGKQALKTLIDWGFNYLNLNQIWGETFHGNPAMKTFLDIGMKKDGVRRQFYFRDGRYLDCYLVSVLREQWKQSK